MADRPRIVLLLLLVLATTAIGLIFAVPAAARVSIVPDTADGGGTQTFAFRLANERSDTASTGLELVFPDTPPVAFVRVAAAPGWNATINSRPLNQPLRAGDRLVTEVADSIVLSGGSVAPRQFEQFMITMGPLPTKGRLVFEGTQRFAGGAVERLTGALAPVISFGGAAPTPASPAPSTARANTVDEPPPSELAAPDDSTGRTAGGKGGLSPLALLWGSLGLAMVVVAIVGLRSYLQRRRIMAEPGPTIEETEEVAR